MTCDECRGRSLHHPCPCCNDDLIKEWRIVASQTLTADQIEAIKRLDDQGLFSAKQENNGTTIYLAFDGEENQLLQAVAEVFDGDFQIEPVEDLRWN